MFESTRHTGSTGSRIPTWLSWQSVLAGALFAGVTGAFFSWLVILPRVEERDAGAKALTDIREENAKNLEVVKNFEQFMANFEKTEALYEAYTARIPLEAEKERVSGDLERLTSSLGERAHGVRARVTLFETGKPNPLQKDRPGMASLSEVPVRIDLRGNYGALKKLLGELTRADRLIAVRNYTMTARADRAYDDPDTVNATVHLVSFFKRLAPAAPPTTGSVATPK